MEFRVELNLELINQGAAAPCIHALGSGKLLHWKYVHVGNMSMSEICPCRKYVHVGNMSMSEICTCRKYVHVGNMSMSEICPYWKYVHVGNLAMSEMWYANALSGNMVVGNFAVGNMTVGKKVAARVGQLHPKRTVF